MASQTLIGREFELGVVGERLAAVRAARGSALVLRGDPGIGKTALADAAAERADGCTVLRAAGVEAQTPLPFATLQALTRPLLRLREQLPPAQQQALGSALALAPPSSHDRFAVPAALLGLLREAAVRAPVVVIVDDLQWVDDASREALLFAARRVTGLRVAIVATTRTPRGDAETARLDQHVLAPLRERAARELVTRVAPDLGPTLMADLLRTAGGNPLALLELPRLLSDEQRSGRAPLDAPLRPGRALERAFAQEIAALPAASQRALTVAAAMDRGPLAWLLAALRVLGLPESALGPAERSGILRLDDDQVALRHALVRAAAYHAATDQQRRRANLALAETTDDHRRRAWHLAGAAGRADRDAEAAAALDAAARSARAVGGHAEAAAAFTRAAMLSSSPEERGVRELEAATDLAVVGRAEQALALLNAAAGRIGPERRGELVRLTGNLRTRRGDPHGAYRLLTAEAERQLVAGHADTATELLLDAIVAQTMTGDAELQQHTMALLVRAGEQADGVAAALADLTRGQDRLVAGEEQRGRAILHQARLRLATVDPVAVTEPLALTAQCCLWADEPDDAAAVLDPLLEAITAASALGRIAYPLSLRAALALRHGRTASALEDAGEAVAFARDTGQETMLSFVLTVLVRAEATVGRFDDARAHAEESLAIAGRRRADGHAAHAHAALGFVELAADRPAWAAPALERAATLADRAGFWHPAVIPGAPDLVEALLADGRRSEAEDRAAALAAVAERSGNRWALAATARVRLLLEPDDERVDQRKREARSRLEGLELPFDAARTALATGERLRAAGRRADARAALTAAFDGFERIGAQPWIRRTRALQRQVGERAAPAPLAALSPDEQQLALLIGRGLTNPEIGALLHVSRKTVERRLTAVYGTLGVRSRTELAALVGNAAGDGPRR